MTEIMVFTIATGAEITATSLNNGTPKTKNRNKERIRQLIN